MPPDRDADPGLPADTLEWLRRALEDHAVELEAPIGAGGSAVVYRGRDRKHGRDVAVKAFRPEGEAGAERSLAEVRVAARLRHPNILPLLDSGRTGDGQVYYLMPLAGSETLRTRLGRGPLPLDEAVRYARDVGEALAYAHGEGLVHGDVKPENILLDAGHAVLADFGLAHQHRQPTAPEPGAPERLVVGTPAYMSPEQIAGEPIDGRSDVYSLGLVLYEMLAGSVPFTGATTVAVLAQRFTRSVEPLAAARPDLPPALDALLARALAVDPAERIGSAGEFIEALTAATRPTGDARGVRSGRGLAVGLLLAAAGIAGAWWSLSPGPKPADPHKLVVADLANETGEARLEPLGREAGDRITARLVDVRGMDVLNADFVLRRPRRGARDPAFRTSPPELRRIADSTGAGIVVSGSYYLDAGQLILFAEVTDTRDGSLLGTVGPVPGSAEHPDAALDTVSDSVAAIVRRVADTGDPGSAQ